MKLLLRNLSVTLVMLAVICSTYAGNVSGWEFSWKFKGEKKRHHPDIAYYSAKADAHLAKGNFWRARYYYKKLYKKSRSLHNRGNAKLAIAVAHYGSNNYRSASETIQEAISLYANYIPFGKALELEYNIAKDHFHGKSDILWTSMSDEAIEIYRHIQANAPFSPFAEKALYSAGMLELEDSNLNAATILFTQLINRYPKSQYISDTRLELIYALLRMAKVAEGDPMLEKRAKSEMRTLATETMDNSQKTRFQSLVVMADNISTRNLLFLGEFYQRPVHWNPKASRRYLEEIITKYTTHATVPRAKSLLEKLPAPAEENKGMPNGKI